MMGRWGYYPFDNDTGADFSGDLDAAAESERVEKVRAALSSVINGGGHIDGGRAEVAIAAAAIAARDRPGGEEFQSEVWGPAGRIPPIPEDVILLAADAISELLDGYNDVKDDWSAESGGAEWFAMMRRLHKVLADTEPSDRQNTLW